MLARTTPLTRKTPIKRTPMKRKAKAKRATGRGPWRSPEYLDWVRARPCCVCQAPAPSQAHHWGGMGSHGTGQKCSDARVSPVCPDCHREWHSRGHFRFFTRDQSEYLQVRSQRDCLEAWVSR